MPPFSHRTGGHLLGGVDTHAKLTQDRLCPRGLPAATATPPWVRNAKPAARWPRPGAASPPPPRAHPPGSPVVATSPDFPPPAGSATTDCRAPHAHNSRSPARPFSARWPGGAAPLAVGGSTYGAVGQQPPRRRLSPTPSPATRSAPPCAAIKIRLTGAGLGALGPGVDAAQEGVLAPGLYGRFPSWSRLLTRIAPPSDRCLSTPGEKCQAELRDLQAWAYINSFEALT